MRAYFQNKYGLPTFMQVDGNVFALGVKTFGEGRLFQNFAAFALGTGTGIGLVLGGELVVGSKGTPDVVLRMPKMENTKRHSGFFFHEFYGATGEELAVRAAMDESYALKCFDQIGESLAVTIRRWVGMFPLDAIILGGGITRGYSFFERAMRESLSGVQIEVVPTQLEFPVLLGGVALAMHSTA